MIKISKMSYYRHGHSFLEDPDTRKSVLEYLLDSIKNDSAYDATRTFIEIFKILTGKHRFFINYETPNISKLKELKEEIQEDYIEFFFDEHLKDMIDFYKKIKNDPFALSYYMPAITKFIFEGFMIADELTKLYLFHINNLARLGDTREDTQKALKEISFKGLKRLYCDTEMLNNLVDYYMQKDLEKFNGVKGDERLFMNIPPTDMYMPANEAHLAFLLFIKQEDIPFPIDYFLILLKQNKEKVFQYLEDVIKEYGLSLKKEILLHNIDSKLI